MKSEYKIIENVNGEEVVRKTLTKENTLKYLMRNCKEPWHGWRYTLLMGIEGLYEGINGNGFVVKKA